MIMMMVDEEEKVKFFLMGTLFVSISCKYCKPCMCDVLDNKSKYMCQIKYSN